MNRQERKARWFTDNTEISLSLSLLENADSLISIPVVQKSNKNIILKKNH